LAIFVKLISDVGKSCLAQQFERKQFNENYDVTIGVEFVSKMIKVENVLLKLQIWDTVK